MSQADAMLPMAFGIIADGPKAIQKILSRNHEAFLKQLQRVAGMVEMGLRVSWDVPNIFEYFVNTHKDLRSARDRFLGPYQNPSQEDKIELGRLFDHLLNEDRETFTEKVEEILSGYCREIKRNKCRNESEVMSLACLVERPTQARFEEGVFEAAKLFDNNYSFDYNGPGPPTISWNWTSGVTPAKEDLMFLIDDLLLSPVKGVLWVFREIHDAAEKELAGESEAITGALSELYMKLETGQITEAQFDAQEKVLLDRLDRLQLEEQAAAVPLKKPAKPRSKARSSRRKSRPGRNRQLSPDRRGPTNAGRINPSVRETAYEPAGGRGRDVVSPGKP